MFIITTAYALTFTLITAAPINNNISQSEEFEYEPVFTPNPQGRGTVSLLVSCLVTLTLCVWTAVHTNPIDNPTPARTLINKIRYVFLALFAPEVMLTIAFVEWRAACKTHHRLRTEGATAIEEGAIDEAVRAIARAEDWLERNSTPLMDSRAQENVQKALEKTRDLIMKNTYGFDQLSQQSESKKGASNRSIPNPPNEVYTNEEPNRDSSASRSDTPADEASNVYSTENTSQNIPTPQKDPESALEFARKARKFTQKLSGVLHCPKRPRKPWGMKFWQYWWEVIVPREEKDDYDFGMEGAFFAVVGGYTIGLRKQREDEKMRLILRPDAIIRLVKARVISIAHLGKLKMDVVDKQKADNMAKLLVCAQALWMCVNCLSRKIYGYPVTLIEINIVTHVACTVLMYICWWRKPHGVDRAIEIPTDVVGDDLASLLYVQGLRNIVLRAFEPKTNSSEYPTELEDIQPERAPPPVGPPGGILSVGVQSEEAPSGGAPLLMFPPNKSGLPVKGRGVELADWGWMEESVRDAERVGGVVMLYYGQTLVDEASGFTIEQISYEPTHITPQDLGIFKVAARTLYQRKHESLWEAEKTEKTEETKGVEKTDEERKLFKPKEITTYLSRRNLFQSISPEYLWGIAPLCLLYGGAHASAWKSHFPTSTEKWLWRGSCVLTGLPGISFIIYLFLKGTLRRIPGKCRNTSYWQKDTGCYYTDRNSGLGKKRLLLMESFKALFFKVMTLNHMLCHPYRYHRLLHYFKRFFIWFVIVISSVARFYIVAECFASLRRLPKGAMDTVSWERFWPHF